jgi:hypothetical protein
MASYSSFKRIATDSFVANTLVSTDFAAGSVTSGTLAPGAVNATTLANNSVGTAQLASTLDLSNGGANTVTYRTITNTDISSSAGVDSTKLASGAAAANLGYTPLNKSGNSMTGALLTTQGSAGTPAVALAGNTNTGIFFNNDNTVRITTAGTERARFDAGGRFVMGAGTPQTQGTPMFQSHGTNGWLYNNQLGSGTNWQALNSGFGWTGYQRNGNGFNYTNGTYTAPVGGHYCFQWLTYQHNDTSWNSATGHMHMSLGKNGAVSGLPSGRVPHGIFSHGNGSPYPHGIAWQQQLYLNAGDYAQVYAYWTSNNNRFHSSHTFFNGFLIA